MVLEKIPVIVPESVCGPKSPAKYSTAELRFAVMLGLEKIYVIVVEVVIIDEAGEMSPAVNTKEPGDETLSPKSKLTVNRWIAADVEESKI